MAAPVSPETLVEIYGRAVEQAIDLEWAGCVINNWDGIRDRFADAVLLWANTPKA